MSTTMTSFDEYSQSIMASAPGEDYQLYSYSASQSYPSVYTPQHQATNQGFGTYNIHPSYPQNTHQDFVLDTDSVHQQLAAKIDYQSRSPPAHSPTHSSANSFDLQPPVLSSTSDSGTSIQSNVSSALGSPSVSIHQAREWNHFPGNMPSIVQQDNLHPDAFAQAFDYEPLVVPKHPKCVGELKDLSPHLHVSKVLPLQAVSFIYYYPERWWLLRACVCTVVPQLIDPVLSHDGFHTPRATPILDNPPSLFVVPCFHIYTCTTYILNDFFVNLQLTQVAHRSITHSAHLSITLHRGALH